MDSPPKSSGPQSGPALDKPKLLAIAEPIARARGAEIADVELKNEGGWVLRFYCERLGAAAEKLSTKAAAIDVNTCAEVARQLSPALDAADPVMGRYHLEVSTPGVERPLRRREDFERFEGEKAKLKLRTPVAGQKVVIAVLGPVKGDALTLLDGERTHEVAIADVVSARLVFEFGPAPKPGKPGSKPGKSGKAKGASKGRKHP